MNHLVNFLSFSRIFFGIAIFLLMALNFSYPILAILFLVAGITDFYDGYLARKFNTVSDLGEILDPISDKFLVIFVLLSLTISLTSFYIGFCSALIISREIWVSALRDLNSRKGNTKATNVMYIAKVKTAIQFLTISIYLVAIDFNLIILLPIADLMLLSTTIITLYTGIIYTYNSFGYKN